LFSQQQQQQPIISSAPSSDGYLLPQFFPTTSQPQGVSPTTTATDLFYPTPVITQPQQNYTPVFEQKPNGQINNAIKECTQPQSKMLGYSTRQGVVFMPVGVAPTEENFKKYSIAQQVFNTKRVQGAEAKNVFNQFLQQQKLLNPSKTTKQQTTDTDFLIKSIRAYTKTQKLIQTLPIRK